MKTRVLVLSLCVAFLGGCCFGHRVTNKDVLVGQQYSQKQYYKHVAMLRIRTLDHSGTGVATGFALNKKYIMTAAHFCAKVLEEQMKGHVEDTIEIVTLNENDELVVTSRGVVDKFDVKADLCVIKAPKHGIIPSPIVKNYNKTVRIRNSDDSPYRVTIVGAPLGVFPTQTHGYVIMPKSSKEDWEVFDLQNRLFVSAPATYGNSGGPIFNDKGEVIGIVIAKSKYDHAIIGAHADTMKAFLKRKYK